MVYGMYAGGLHSSLLLDGCLFNIITLVWVFLATAVDILITIALFFCLRGEIRGCSAQTDDIMRQVIRLGIETGGNTAS